MPPCGHVHQQANNFHKISGKKRLHKLTARRLDDGQKHILRPTLGHWGFMSSQTQPPRRRQSSFVTGLIPTFTEWRKVTTQSGRNASPLCFSSFLCVKIAVVCRKTRRKATTLTTGKRVVPARGTIWRTCECRHAHRRQADIGFFLEVLLCVFGLFPLGAFLLWSYNWNLKVCPRLILRSIFCDWCDWVSKLISRTRHVVL